MRVISRKTDHSLRLVSEVFKVNRSNFYYRKKQVDLRQKLCMCDRSLLNKIRKVIAERGSYGYRRIAAWLRNRLKIKVNKKRVYRIMKRFGLLLKRFSRSRRIHQGRVAVDRSNHRWSSDITGIVCWNGQRGRFVFIIDCCDREILSWRFGQHLQWVDLAGMLDEAIAYRFGDDIKTAEGIEFLHDNGPEFTANAFKQYVEDGFGMIDCCTPNRSPESNGLAEAFIGTFKRDYVYENVLEDFEMVSGMIPGWIADHNTVAPHSALGMLSPQEFIKNRAA